MHILYSVVLLLVSELLVLVLLDPFIEVAWNSRVVVESWFVDSVFVFAGDDEWRALLFGGLRVDVHAFTWLHTRRNWLICLLCEVGHVVALNNLDFEVNIRMERDRLTANWSPGESTAPDII